MAKDNKNNQTKKVNPIVATFGELKQVSWPTFGQTMKRLGAVLVVAGVLALVGTFIDTKLVLPIIAIVVTVAVLLCVLATGGKKWDEADNTKVGYKDYRTRKREQEEREARERDRKDDE